MFGTWLETSTLLVFFTLGVRPYLRLSQPLTSNSKNRIQIVLSPEKWLWLITSDIHFLCNWHEKVSLSIKSQQNIYE